MFRCSHITNSIQVNWLVDELIVMQIFVAQSANQMWPMHYKGRLKIVRSFFFTNLVQLTPANQSCWGCPANVLLHIRPVRVVVRGRVVPATEVQQTPQYIAGNSSSKIFFTAPLLRMKCVVTSIYAKRFCTNTFFFANMGGWRHVRSRQKQHS